MIKKQSSGLTPPLKARKTIHKRQPQGQIRPPATSSPPKERPRKRMRRKIDSHRMEINPYTMYESSPTYVLDDLNSIAVCNDRFYNLLKLKPKATTTKVVKCKCSKSKCDARYCQCFAKGQICSLDCSCTDCLNVLQERHLSKGNSLSLAEEGGCRCSKSQCLKNYCDCFQKGETCSLKCRCKNCLNYL